MLSLTKPQNQSVMDYRQDEAEWKMFCQALERLPSKMDIPSIIGDKDIYSDQKISDICPMTGEGMATAQKNTRLHTEQAIAAALQAKEVWANLPWEHRIARFRDLEQILYTRRHEICAAIALECGYSLAECAGEWGEMLDFISFNTYYYHELQETKLGEGTGETNTLRLRPLKGFTCAITPFNFPVAIGYNLPTVMALCGNTVVWKPSSDTPLLAWILMQAIRDADFPPGVVNMITGPGSETMGPVLQHPELTAVNFTGGYDTARHIASRLYSQDLARPHFPRLVAETGGKGFMVIDKQANVYDVAQCIVAGAFGRSGQKCSANSLVLCHKHIWPEVKACLIELLKNFKTGNPLERDVEMGPVINKSSFDKITGFIERARHDRHCHIFSGGQFSDAKGFFIQPTCIEVGSFPHELVQTEIFGPVVSFYIYEDMDKAVQIVNQIPYRLTGAIWSADAQWLSRYVPIFSEYAGNFYVNRKTTGAMVDRQPFGGDGASGTNGKAGGLWYLLHFISQGVITWRHTRHRQSQTPWEWTQQQHV